MERAGRSIFLFIFYFFHAHTGADEVRLNMERAGRSIFGPREARRRCRKRKGMSIALGTLNPKPYT